MAFLILNNVCLDSKLIIAPMSEAKMYVGRVAITRRKSKNVNYCMNYAIPIANSFIAFLVLNNVCFDITIVIVAILE